MQPGNLNSAELYDRGLGFVNDWRPTISAIPSELINDKPHSFIGTGFSGYNLIEDSYGGTYNSATNYPLVQIRRLDNEQLLWLPPNSFNAKSYTSLPVTMQNGPARVTMIVNGIPSVSKMIVLNDLYYFYLPFVFKF